MYLLINVYVALDKECIGVSVRLLDMLSIIKVWQNNMVQYAL